MSGSPLPLTPLAIKIEAFLNKGVGQVFPGAVLIWGQPSQEAEKSPSEKSPVKQMLAVGRRGLTRDNVPVTLDLIYDLASLTKILATTFLAMIETTRGALFLDATLGDYGWVGTVRNVTIRDLLAHRSGLPPWRPLYRLKPEPTLRASYQKAIEREEIICSPGTRVIYSDLNFLALGFVLEDLNQLPLDELFAERIKKTLDLGRLGYKPTIGPVAPTEDGYRVGGPLDYPGAPILGPTPLGRVHDDNAAGLGGVAGQAGLFGNALDVWRVVSHWAQSLANQGSLTSALISPKVLGAFLEPQSVWAGAPRALGFELGQGELAGLWGHWGYTGGGVWWDPVNDWALVFLSNRVHPTARERGILAFRRELVGLARSLALS
ncbi:MAG: beta-lactamase family protein [Deltaproteobacteria bacterium]|nr:beta-lactamase family protein [Deltaproteobacteria bacterium]